MLEGNVEELFKDYCDLAIIGALWLPMAFVVNPN
jgi:hypothetical protein